MAARFPAQRLLSAVFSLVAVALAFGTNACGGSVTGSGPETRSAPAAFDTPTQFGLPDLPVGAPAKLASNTELSGKSGKNFYMRSVNNTSVNAQALELHPGPDVTAWAVYEFAVSGFDYGWLHINATVNNPEKVWYALADYNTGRWQYFPATEVQSELQPLEGENRSQAGNAYLAVIAFDETFVSFEGFYCEIEVPGWQNHVLEQGNLTGWISDMELINDRLYLVYQQYEDPFTNLARAMVAEPLFPDDWDISIAINNVAAVDLDLEAVDGLPALTYIYYQSGELTYAYANGLEPSSPADWNVYDIATVDALPSEMQPQALADVDGRPAVIYVKPDGFKNEVWYGIGNSSQPLNENEWTHHLLGIFGAGIYSHSGVSLASTGTRPMVSLHGNYGDELIYGKGDAANPVDSSGWTTYSVVANGGAGNPSKIAVVDGVPYIAMRRADLNELWFMPAKEADPNEAGSWGMHLIAFDVGPQFDLTARPGGGFAMAWRDVYDSVYYAETDLDHPTKSSDWRVAEARFGVGTNGDVSVAIADTGRPYIALVAKSDTAEELRILRMGVT